MWKSQTLVEGREVTFWHMSLERVIVGKLTGYESQATRWCPATWAITSDGYLVEISWKDASGLTLMTLVHPRNILTPEALQ